MKLVRLGEADEIYPRARLTLDTIVVFTHKNEQYARKHIRYINLDITKDNSELIEAFQNIFRKECELTINKGLPVEGVDIKIL